MQAKVSPVTTVKSPPSVLPKHWGTNFTPTVHKKVTPSTDPTRVELPPSSTILITGTGKGFGASTVLSYAQAGASAIIIVARTSSDLDSVSKQIADITPSTKVPSVPCDIKSEEQVIGLAKKVKETFNRLDVLINNAGKGTSFILDASVPSGKRFEYGFIEGSSTEFRDCFDLTFFAVYLCTRHLLPLMIATDGGAKAVINPVSDGAHLSDAYLSLMVYNISKFAVVRMSEYLDACRREEDGVVCFFALHPDDVEICGGFCVWLTKERREWLSGLYMMANWDVEELEGMKYEIVEGQKLKFTMDV